MPASLKPLRLTDLRVWTRDDPPALVPLVPNAVQARLLADVCQAYGCDPARPWELRGARVNVLKARQQGMSTLWLAIWYLGLYNLEYSQAVIITHRAESTQMLWQRVQLWEQQLRKEQQRPLPDLRYSNRRELRRADTGASLFIGTAGQDDLTRSGTITTVHSTESAFWELGAAASVFAGMLGTLPGWANQVEESTANGYGDHYDRYEAEMRPGSAVRAYFFPYTDTDEYASPPPEGWEPDAEDAGLTCERIIAGTVEVVQPTPAQLHWRAAKRADYRDKGIGALLDQEFPPDPVRAFRASATGAVYDVDYLMALLPTLPEPVEVWRPESLDVLGFGGVLRVYEYPITDGSVEYVAFGDLAEGELVDKGRDAHTLSVFRRDTRTQVAAYDSYEHQCGEYQAEADWRRVGEWYGWATLCIEREARAVAVLNSLEGKRGLTAYPNLYRYQFPTDQEQRQEGRTVAGWPNGAPYKARRDQGLQEAIATQARMDRDGLDYDAVHLRDRATVEQLIHYVHLPGARRGGEGRWHDDHNTSAGGALLMCDVAPHPVRVALRPVQPVAHVGGSTPVLEAGGVLAGSRRLARPVDTVAGRLRPVPPAAYTGRADEW